MRDSAAYATEAAGRIAAQYRFAGLIAGIKGPNDTDEDVDAARAALIDAIKDFLTMDPRPLEEQIDSELASLRDERRALDSNLIAAGSGLRTNYDIFPQRVHPSILNTERLEGIASDEADARLAQSIDSEGLSPELAEQLRSVRSRAKTIAALETQRRRKLRAEQREFFTEAWSKIKSYYDDKIALVKEGKYLLASTKIVVDGIEVFHADIAIALIAAGIIAITGGITAIAAPIIVGAVAAAVRVVKVGAGVLRRTGYAARHGDASGVFSILVHKVDKSALDTPVARSQPHYDRRVDTSKDLTENERLLLNEENQGTTRPTDDAGQRGTGAASRLLKRDQDYDEIMASLPKGTAELAASAGASKAQRDARQTLITAYWAKFGADETMVTGMTVNRPMRIIKYPPPDTIANWRAEGSPHFGAYYDPIGSATPNELGLNSVGRVKATIDVSEKPGIAFQAYGDEIIDDWSVVGPNGARRTDGGALQWHVPREYKPEMADKIDDVMTWRALPGNAHYLQAEKEKRLKYERRGDDEYPRWYLDGPEVPDAEGAR
ncbi:MAG: hypothetical protein DI498_14870 [Paracoccus denitrificans]|nr:MAG: hypothetical protein DI498_14870 [Paracoccus denitrificans]PZO82584.1 MAG: hypothetical protein DI633_14870 [Paracoccus denitrificans]